MVLFDGKNSHLSSPAARREVDVSQKYKESFPEEWGLESSLRESGCAFEEEYFEHKGKKLSTSTFVPKEEDQNSKGLLWCHGYTDSHRWTQRYALLNYASKGFVVTGLEIEGHGLSDGRLGLVQSIPKALDYLEAFFLQQKEKFPKIDKWFVHGESMGGMFALNMGLRQPDNLAGIILLAPMCRIAKELQPAAPVRNILISLSKRVGAWAVTPGGFDPKLVFKDPKAAVLDSSDPLKFLGKVRLCTARELLLSTNQLEKDIPNLQVPFIVFHGKKDIVTSSEASQFLYDNTSKISEDKKNIVLLDDCWHSILWGELQETRTQVWEDIFQWIWNH